MDKLFREQYQTIKIYIAKETIDDPYERNVSLTYLNPLPIKAIVSDVGFASAIWKMPGISAEKVKEIIIEKRYKSLLLKSQKIEIDDEYFYGYKINGKLQYRQEDEYLRCYVYFKKEN